MTYLSEPRIVEGPPLVLAGVNQYFTWETKSQIPSVWQKFGPHIGAVPHQIGDVAYGVCHRYDDAGFHYMAAVEVSEVAELPEELVVFELPAERYAVFTHHGDLSALSQSMSKIFNNWLPSSGRQLARERLIFERYGPAFDPDLGSGDIELWLGISE